MPNSLRNGCIYILICISCAFNIESESTEAEKALNKQLKMQLTCCITTQNYTNLTKYTL